MLLLIVSFIAGILTILAPCVLPVLPVILGSSVNDKKANKKKTSVFLTNFGMYYFKEWNTGVEGTAFDFIQEYEGLDKEGNYNMSCTCLQIKPEHTKC